ncbi:protein-tyrosine phosphatase-like protein [Lasiosphaeria miniovina]|uniref:protein-tyrosine-phosphatase n=1 Tax=Lasiosphaeria miniovina TaxID=1954250 RepID=A0AA40DQJ8_9PEZI|nr:protein-tyrosine phosphatase-like protein [Lasiosphaeria miniovina]KAK0712414.1 protein-tyrosine phosphatase-like protein [Lasiosphaeria miniovina]
MALNRINGKEDLYVGGLFGLRRKQALKEGNITHVLSVIKYSLDFDPDTFANVQHLSVDIDDDADQDILVQLPKMVRFIESGLYGDASRPGGVFVHCAMGVSRSVSAVIAYLLWKYPHRFGRSSPTTTPEQAVTQALELVRETRPIAEPNSGFMRQLGVWWEMGCPADSDDAVEKKPAYQRWVYKREVDDAARIGRVPDWIRFEDEEAEKQRGGGNKEDGKESGLELRCKKCRRVMATKPFILEHRRKNNAERPDCPHYFIEALSWMRPVLEEGALDGRLVCPNAKCSASIGRYAWQGFKCSCGDWVAPAFSLQKSKVDDVVIGPRRDQGMATAADRMAALGIRMPPGKSAASLVLPTDAAATSPPTAAIEGQKENL